MSPVLFNDAKGLHDCIMFYNQAVAADAALQLYAVRCGDYKMYWRVRSTQRQPYPSGLQNPPLLFNLTADPSESHPISSATAEYAAANVTLHAARQRHLATITPVPDQNGRGSDRALAFCGDPHSLERFPQLPNCTLTPANFMPLDICHAPAACSSRFVGQCRRPMCTVTEGGCARVDNRTTKGCYADHVNDKCDLSVLQSGHCGNKSMPAIAGMDLDICNALCHGHRYFGVQAGGAGCYCGEHFGLFGRSAACNMSCVGDPSTICGGDNANSVFAVVEEK